MTINQERLLEYLAGRMHTNIRIQDEEYSECKFFTADTAPDDSCILTQAFLERMGACSGRMPYIVKVNHDFFYVSLRIGMSLFVIGPMQSRLYFESRQNYSAVLTEADETKLKIDLQPQLLQVLLEDILLISNSFTAEYDPVPERKFLPKDVTEENMISERTDEKILSAVTQSVFNNLETSVNHNPFDEEIREMAAVERGDEDLLRQIIGEVYNGRVGILAKDPLRHQKNLGVVIITISCRAAIRGGVPYEVAFSMSDRFIQELEEKKTVREAEAVARAGEYEFTRAVRNYREAIRSHEGGKENEHVEHCKEYIFRHLHEKIRVSRIAESLAMNSNYLSTIFRKCEGITISDYILRQKLLLVRNMLIYSEYSYLEITNYLGFPSQSYLGKRFKEETGMTLREFRTRYRVRDFRTENNMQAGR